MWTPITVKLTIIDTKTNTMNWNKNNKNDEENVKNNHEYTTNICSNKDLNKTGAEVQITGWE